QPPQQQPHQQRKRQQKQQQPHQQRKRQQKQQQPPQQQPHQQRQQQRNLDKCIPQASSESNSIRISMRQTLFGRYNRSSTCGTTVDYR
ncbi:unnamed protein product, partial [Rotaria socialis]